MAEALLERLYLQHTDHVSCNKFVMNGSSEAFRDDDKLVTLWVGHDAKKNDSQTTLLDDPVPHLLHLSTVVKHLVAENAWFVPALARAFDFTTHLEESCSLRRGSLVYDIGAQERCPVGHKSETRGDNT
jgi:hypothetical protein